MKKKMSELKHLSYLVDGKVCDYDLSVYKQLQELFFTGNPSTSFRDFSKLSPLVVEFFEKQYSLLQLFSHNKLSEFKKFDKKVIQVASFSLLHLWAKKMNKTLQSQFSSFKEIIENPEMYETLNFLISVGVNINSTNNHEPIIHLICRKYVYPPLFVKKLIQHQLDIYSVDENKNTLLHVLAQKDKLEMSVEEMKLLIQLKDLKNIKGQTPLYLLEKRGMKKLLDD